MSVPTPPLVSVRPRVTSTTLEFWWAAPASPNGTISSYILSCVSPSITETYSATTYNAIVTGLTIGTDYSFTLVAVNETGNSDPAPFRTVRTSNRPQPVATLTPSQSTSAGILSVTYTWTNPVDDYAYYYVIGLRAAAGTKDYIYRGTRDLATVSFTTGGLDPSQLYTFHVQRGNDFGYSTQTTSTTTRVITFNPTSVTGLQVWYDATDTAGNGSTVADGTAIATWVDKSGNSRNATAAGGSSTLQTDSAGRRLNFNGTSNRYNLSSSSWSYGTPVTVFVADSPTDISGAKALIASSAISKDGFAIQYTPGNGFWVAGGYNQSLNMYYSTDGINWNVSVSGSNIFLSSVRTVKWNGRIWVAGGLSLIPYEYGSGYGTMAYSYDGVNWTESVSAKNIFNTGGNVYAVAWNGYMWVAGGYGIFNGNVAYSYDGINWVAAPSPFNMGQGYAVATSGSNFWLAGYAYSTDGINWTPSASIQSEFTGGAIYAYAYNGTNLWVAGGSGATSLAYSSDGITWTASASGNALISQVNAVAWNGAQWVAVGHNTAYGSYRIVYSSDGQTWTGSSSGTPFFDNGAQSITWSGTTWVASGQSTTGMSLAYSTDGINWLGVTTSGAIGSQLVTYTPVNLYNVSANVNTGLFVAATGATPNTIMYSADGISWSQSTTQPISTYVATTANNSSMWIMVGYTYLSYSYSGTKNWQISTSASSIFTNRVYAIAWNGSSWYAGGQTSGSAGALAYSSDGINWTSSASGNALLTSNVSVIAATSSIWVAGGQGDNRLIYSTDGTTWNASATGNSIFANNVVAMATDGSTWVAGADVMAYSTNGTTWTSLTSPFTSGCLNIATNGSTWVAVGQGTNQVAYSSDGISWTASTSANALITGTGSWVAWGNGVWVVMGALAAPDYTKKIIYSTDGINWTLSNSGTSLSQANFGGVAFGQSPGIVNGPTYFGDQALAGSNFPYFQTNALVATATSPITYVPPVSQTFRTPVNVVCTSIDATKSIAINNQGLNRDGSGDKIQDAVISIGAIRGSSAFYKGGMREILVYTGSLSDVDKGKITDYLNSKWQPPPLLLVPDLPVKHGLAQWLDAKDITTLYTNAAGTTRVTSNNNPVAWWRDKSGNGYDLSGSATAVYKSSNINSFPSVDCSGALLSSAPAPTASEITVFAVIKNQIGSGSKYNIWTHNVDTLAGSFPGIYWAPATTDPFSTRLPYVTNRAAVYIGTVTKAQLAGFESLDLSGTAVRDTTEAAQLTFGGKATIHLGLRSGAGIVSVGEIIYYQRVLTSEETTAIVAYLENKWGITVPDAPSLTENLQLWLDASDPYTVITSGSIVTAWNDKSGNGNNMTPVGSPTYASSGVVFNGTSQYFDLPNGALPSGDSSYSYYAVTKLTDLSGYGILGGGAGTTDYGRLALETYDARRLCLGVSSSSGGFVGVSTDGINWSVGASAISGVSTLYSIAYNGSMWVAGGAYYTTAIVYSYDGLNWKQASSPFDTGVVTFAWNGSMWIAGGSSSAFIGYSYDGIAWTNNTSGSALFTTACSAVAWNGSMFVCGGQGTNQMGYSYDGFTWAASASGNGIFTTSCNAIAWNGTLWVAGGAGTNQLAYSSDGIAWTASTSGNAIFTTSCLAVAWNGTLWVACGSGTNTLAYSSNGSTWTASASGSALFTSSAVSVAWNGTVWIASGTGATDEVAYSTDGMAWTASASGNSVFPAAPGGLASLRVLPSTSISTRVAAQTTIGPPPSGPDNALRGIRAVPVQTVITGSTVTPSVPGSKFMVAGGSGTNQLAYSSDNGDTWTASTTGNAIFTTNCLAVAWNGTTWVAGGSGTNTLAYSSDGIAWTASSSGTALFTTQCNAVAWSGTRWVAGGSGTNQLAYSSDGITWTASASGNGLLTTNCQAVAWNGSIWVAGGSGTSYSLIYSKDGITWTGVVNSSSFLNGPCASIAWNGSLWVAGGSTGQHMAYSTDGANWGYSNPPFTTSTYSIAWNGSLWVAGGQGTNQLAYSSDGINWLLSTSGNTLLTTQCFTVAWTGDKWFAGGSGTNQMVYSANGISWTASSTGNAIFTTAVSAIASNMVLPIQRLNTTSTNPSSFLVESFYSSGNPMTQYMNAALDATDSATITHAQLTTNNQVGKTPSGKYMKGSIYEIMVYNVAHTALKRQQVEAYLLSKWIQPAFTPASIIGPCLWLDSSDPANLVLSGTDVLSWTDKSVKGVNYTPAVAGCYPQYAYDPITKKYGVLFGSKGYATGLTNATTSLFYPSTTSYTMIFVARFNNTNHTNTIYNGVTPSYYYAHPRFNIYNGNIYTTFPGLNAANVSTSYAVASKPTQTFIGNANFTNQGYGYPTSDFRLNTTPISSVGGGDAGSFASSMNFTIGYNGIADTSLATAGGLNGYIFEYIVLPYSVNATKPSVASAELQRLEGYLAWKWGIEETLPAAHPYAARAP